TKRGYDMWAEKINALGGIEVGGKRYKVKMVYADAQSQPSVAASAADRLAVQDKADFVLGPYASGITKAAAPIFDKYKIPMITGSAESPALWTQKPPFEYTFGAIPPASFTGPGALQALAGLPDAPKTAFVYGFNDAFSKPTGDVFKATCEKLGIKVLKYSSDLPEKSDLTFIATLARSLKPDVICLGAHEEDLINMVKVLVQANFTPKALVMHYGVTNPGFVKALGKNAEEVMGGSVWTERMSLKGADLWTTPKQYADEAMAKYKVPADYTQAACTATGIFFQHALAKLGQKPPLSEAARIKLRDVIRELEVMTFYGKIKFATEGQFRHANVGLVPLGIQI
ncbi:MAG: amino acid ABC transporter substrate-binding protein, partial [Thermodesulfobacteriota bacterium]